MSYTWDGNGNLLSDGVNTYTYNHADRLNAVSSPQYSIQNGYNGLGDRLRQTVNGLQTNYALDLNNSISQALSDGSNTYLYGLGRIAQQNVVGRQYHLGDALGSVRQLTNAAGTVTEVRSYEPFGSVLNSAGDSLTPYGFTGEWQDPTGLVFLRARYYDPATGRFLSKDPVKGSIALPGTLNPYTYVFNNPIKFIDPTGHTSSSTLLGYWLETYQNYNTPTGTPQPPYRPSQTPGPPTPPMIPSFSNCSSINYCSSITPLALHIGPGPTPTPTPLPFGVAASQLLDMYQPELNNSFVEYIPPQYINNPIVKGLIALQIFLDAYWTSNQVIDYFSSNRPTATPLLPCMIPPTPTP